MYELIRPALFRLQPEQAHALAMGAAKGAAIFPTVLKSLGSMAHQGDWRLRVEAFGHTFAGPLGLAAGLDKDAEAVLAWWAMGLSFLELGTVTPLPQPGNPKPRVHRLVPDRAIINAMGFPSLGAVEVGKRIERLRDRGDWPSTPVIVNLGKNRATALEDAYLDYASAARILAPVADMFVLNVSSPNTPGLRTLQDESQLRTLLHAVLDAAPGLPLLIKFAPDMEDALLTRLTQHAEADGAAGFVAVNTTLGRSGLSQAVDHTGGLSGRPLARRSLEVLKVLRAATTLPIISVGGIDGPEEALVRLRAGADFLQLYTGLIYEGPMLPRKILRHIQRTMDTENATSISDLRQLS